MGFNEWQIKYSKQKSNEKMKNKASVIYSGKVLPLLL